MALIADDGSKSEVELPIPAMAEARLVLTDDLIRAALRREKAALKDAKRASGRGNGRETIPGAKRETNEPKAAARGAASKLLGPDEGENHGR
jgi:ribosome maturation factor RimP